MRRDPEFFDEPELDLIYMARTLRNALRLEAILSEAGIDYAVETGTYTMGFLIKRELTGAFFYVAPRDTKRAKETLVVHKYSPYAAN